jgi:hypothetical protein
MAATRTIKILYTPELKKEIIDLWVTGDFITRGELAEYLIKKYNFTVAYTQFSKGIASILSDYNFDKELLNENVRLSKKAQKAQDNNRIQNKSFREYARVENAVEEYAKAILETNKKFAKQLGVINVKPNKHSTGGVGVIQITDVHGNELVDLPHNKYDFHVLSRRLKKHITESLNYFEYRKVSKVLIAFTGDLLNSDRRLDELLGASTNRSKATVMMVHLFKQAIIEVASKYPVSIVSVLGNESRVNKEMTFSNEALSDNYDFTIIAQLEQIFAHSKVRNVKFLGHDKVKEVVDFGKQKWLISHNLNGTVDNQVKTQSEIGMYSLMGHNIDYSIGGHIHATRITDFSARSSSMAGSNTYNENALGLLGRATHNCYVVNGKQRFIQINDLQDTEGVKGYEIVKAIEAYNAKSNAKLKVEKTIMSIVI